MILKDLGLSAWIAEAKGKRLPEYGVKPLDDNKIECWIPSVEGTNFEIEFQASEGTWPNLGLRCIPYLDGIRMGSVVQLKSEVAKGEIGYIYHQPVSSSTTRLYRFGRRQLTDSDDGLRPDKFVQEHLNTIRVELALGCIGRRTKRVKYETPKDSQPIHEQAAKKGHAGSAGLGEVIPTPITSVPYEYGFNPNPSVQPGVFIFRYAPMEWLKAREVIPCSPEPELIEPSPQTRQKRSRDATLEVIDVDSFETDDDDIVFVKHMIPAPGCSGPKQGSDPVDMVPKTSKNKRHKVKAEKNVKPKGENK